MRRHPVPKHLPRPAPPDAAEREYYRNIRRYSETLIRKLRAGLKALVPDLKDESSEALEPIVTARADSVRMDADSSKAIGKLFDKITKDLKAEFSDQLLERWAWTMVDQVNRLGKRNIQKIAKKLGADVEPLLKDGEMNPYFQRIVGDNVGLIRSLSDIELPALKNKLVAMISADATQAQIADAIQASSGTTRNKARLLARDQVGKLNGKVDQYRQRALGGKRYTWRGSLDRRERKDHRRLEGKVFSWDKPPIINRSTGKRGHPKDDIQCRCWAEMVVKDILA